MVDEREQRSQADEKSKNFVGLHRWVLKLKITLSAAIIFLSGNEVTVKYIANRAVFREDAFANNFKT